MKYKYRHRENYKGREIDIKANTTKELAEKIDRKHKQIDRIHLGSDTMLADFGRNYIEIYKKPVVSDEWYHGLNSIFTTHILSGIGNRKFSSIHAMEVQSMLNSLDFSSGFIGKVFNLTCQIFHSAYINGLTETDISSLITRPKGRKAVEGKSMTSAEQKVMLHVLEGHRGETSFKLMYYCGLRPKETRTLQWKDIDLKNKLIHIRGTKTVNADRIVPVPDVLFSLLKDNYGSPFEFVCITDEQCLKRAWKAVMRKMNLEMGCRTYRNKLVPPYPVQDLRMYDLRHTYCTNLELAGVPLSIASRLMGHSDISLTAKIYTHDTAEAVEIARSLINAV